MSGLEDFRRKLLSPEKLAEETLQWLHKYPGAKVVLKYFSQYGLVNKNTAECDLEYLSNIIKLIGVCESCGTEYDIHYRKLLDGLRERDLIKKEKSMGEVTFFHITEYGMKYTGARSLPKEKESIIEKLTSELGSAGVAEGKINVIGNLLIEISERVSAEELYSECEKIKNSFSESK